MAESISQHTPVNEREQAALAYAKNGWKILPLKPFGKTPYAGNGVKHATTDAEQIRAWFQDNPKINIGIATGEGLIVLDADSPEAEAFLATQGATRTVRTGKGRHFYYESSKAFKNAVGKLREKLDVRSLGGYIVAPPSVHENGTTYRWEDDSIPVASLPKELETALDNLSRKPEPSGTPSLSNKEMIPEGSRNASLTKIAGNLVHRFNGLSLEQVQALLQLKNEELCQPPLPCDEVNAIAASIFSAESKTRPNRSIRILNRAELRGLPKPEFLIDGLLVRNSLAILYGDPGAAKTFLALDMGIRVATGSPWFGQEVSLAPVVYVCAEGHSGIERRIMANEYRTSVSAKNFWLVDSAIQLHQPADVAQFIALLH